MIVRSLACQRLGEGEYVRHDIKVLVPKQLAGAPQAALHLIKHQQCSSLITQVTQALQEVVIGRENAPFALYRLHKDSSRLPLQRAPSHLGLHTACKREISGALIGLR